ALTGNTLTLNLINGNQNLSISGNNFLLNGALVLNTVSVTGTGSNNTFTLNNGSSQNWAISGTDAGSLSGITGISGAFTFSNVQNINAGNQTNSFTFANNASLSGQLNGGSLANTNTLNYAAYSTPIQIQLTPD